jgi:hypothetical protein
MVAIVVLAPACALRVHPADLAQLADLTGRFPTFSIENNFPLTLFAQKDFIRQL